MTNRKQSGFGPIGVVVSVLLLAMLIYVGYRLYGHFIIKPVTTTVSNTQTNPNAGYVVIKEWKVRFKPVGGLEGMEYAIRSSNTTAVFSSQQLVASDAHCDAHNTNYTGIGSISRVVAGSSAPFGGTLLTTVNGYDYYYQGAGQASCIADPNNTSGRTLLQNTDTQFFDSIKSLEAAK